MDIHELAVKATTLSSELTKLSALKGEGKPLMGACDGLIDLADQVAGYLRHVAVGDHTSGSDRPLPSSRAVRILVSQVAWPANPYLPVR